MRKLVTLRKIAEIKPIPNADAIEVAMVDGWECVVKKGEFNPGDWVVYFEIDSILPYGDERFAFLMTRGCKWQPTDDGGLLEGHRLRTIKLRGQVSQGLVLSIPENWILSDDWDMVQIGNQPHLRYIDEDFSDIFGVKKYEKPIPAQLAGMIAGNYPSWLPKTDQERVQNCYEKAPDVLYSVEEKYEGSSMTVYHDGEKVGVTSRNLDLKLDQEGNTFVDVAKASGLITALEKYQAFWPGDHNPNRIAIRGELVGPGIQDNIYQLKDFAFMLYDVFANGRYLTPDERFSFLCQHIAKEVDHKVVMPARQLFLIRPKAMGYTVQNVVSMANGLSELFPTKREGLVFKSTELVNGQVFSFKAVSPEYLLSEK